MTEKKIFDQRTTLRLLKAMLSDSPRKVVDNANVPLTVFPF
jgi:hypothetical protein